MGDPLSSLTSQKPAGHAATAIGVGKENGLRGFRAYWGPSSSGLQSSVALLVARESVERPTMRAKWKKKRMRRLKRKRRRQR